MDDEVHAQDMLVCCPDHVSHQEPSILIYISQEHFHKDKLIRDSATITGMQEDEPLQKRAVGRIRGT